MRYRLAPHVSFARLGDSFVFLDRRADRYWCLDGALARAFGGIAAGEKPTSASAVALQPLVAGGLLTREGGSEISPCLAAVPRESLLDRPHPAIAMAWRFEAILGTERARVSLRVRGLHRTLERLETRRPTGEMAEAEVAGLVSAYSAPGWFRAAEGECLRRSIGLMAALARYGRPANLVMAVKLHPFAAHCWVQTETLLLNERCDRVRDFTPVLVL